MGKKKATQSPSKKTKAGNKSSDGDDYASANGEETTAPKQQVQKGKQGKGSQQKGSAKSKSTSSGFSFTFWIMAVVFASSVVAGGVFYQQEIQTAADIAWKEYINPSIVYFKEEVLGEKLSHEERNIPTSDEGSNIPDRSDSDNNNNIDQTEQKAEMERKERERKQIVEEERQRKQKEEEEKQRKLKEEEEKRRKQREEEERQRKQREEEERQRKLKEEEEKQRKRREEEERQRKEEEERLKKQKEEEEKQRKQKEEEERQRKKREEEEKLRKQKEEEEKQRKQREEEERQRKAREEEERQRKAREEEERQRKLREEEERQRKKKEEEERQRKVKEEEERLKKQKEEEEKQRKQKEEEERQRKKREEEEKLRKQKEEEERKRRQKEEEERQRKKREEEEKLRKQKEEEERQRKQKEEEEKKRKQREEEDRQRKLKEEEEKQRKQKEEEEKLKKKKLEEEEKQKKQKDEEEKQRKQKEEEEKLKKKKLEEEEKQRKQKDEEERLRKQKMEEEKQRKQQEENQRKQKEEEERLRKQKEVEERQRKQKEEEEKERKQKEEEKQRMLKEEEAKLRKQKEQEEKQRKEEEERQIKQREEERVKKEEGKKAKEEAEAVKKTMDRTNYEHAALTNDEDLKIAAELDEADSLLEKESLEEALQKYDVILRSSLSSPRAHYGKGLTLDKLGFKHQSNEYLEEAINFLSRTLILPDVPDELFKLAGRKLADRQQFRGWGGETIKTYRKLVKRFPQDVKLQNDLGVSYMMIGQNERAKDVFKQVLAVQPDSGFAKAHIGFILKDQRGAIKEAVRYLRAGVESEEEGTQDGRFYLHLGDCLIRLGKMEEARKVYQAGEDKGLFISAWQRSLYNVDGLTSRPWWTVEQTGYTDFFKALKDNWKVIREEGLAQLNAKTGAFQPEDENLRDTGDWKQFTLYQQGRKSKANCEKAPKTCALIQKFPNVESCSRGQIKFSVMSPGIHVWPHTGPTNCRIRSHLGLVVPQGPYIRVMNETRQWKEGELLIFDDSFEHEVWHDGSELRLVLIVDVWHPELTKAQRRTLSPI